MVNDNIKMKKKTKQQEHTQHEERHRLPPSRLEKKKKKAVIVQKFIFLSLALGTTEQQHTTIGVGDWLHTEQY